MRKIILFTISLVLIMFLRLIYMYSGYSLRRRNIYSVEAPCVTTCLDWLDQEGLDELVNRLCENYKKKQYDDCSEIFEIISFNKDIYKSPSGEESSFLKEMKECRSLPHALKHLFEYNLDCLKKKDARGKVRITSQECKGIFRLYYADLHVAIIYLSNDNGIANVIVFKNPKFVVVGEQIFFYNPQDLRGGDLKNAVVYVNQSIFAKQIIDKNNELKGKNMLSYMGVSYRKMYEDEKKMLNNNITDEIKKEKVDILCQKDDIIIYATLSASGEHSDFYFDFVDKKEFLSCEGC